MAVTRDALTPEEVEAMHRRLDVIEAQTAEVLGLARELAATERAR